MSLSAVALSFMFVAFGQSQSVTHWEPMGPFGGSAAVIQVDPKHAGTVIAATNNSLLFRSKNSGESWDPLPFGPQLRSTLHAFAITKTGVYFACISSDTSDISGIYRSRDEGGTWEQLPGLARREVWSIAIWDSDANTIAAGTRNGVYLTTDGGTTWKHVSPDDNEEMAPVVSLAIDPKNSSVMYAGTPHLPWKTTDAGVTWHSIHDGMLDDSDVFSIHVDASEPQRVFASACSGIYRSENAAGGWMKMKAAKDASYRTYIITQDPREPRMIYAGTTSGLQKSSDGGVNWRRISPHATRWIAFDSSVAGRMFFATDEAGIFRSDDGGETLQPMNKGFCNRQLPALAWTGTSALMASIYEPSFGGVFELKTGAKDWERIASASALPVQVLKLEAGSQAKIFASSYDSILSSSDGGRKWAAVPAPKGLKVAVFLGTEKFVFAATDAGLFRNEVNSKTWTRVEGPFGSQKIRLLTLIGERGMAAATLSSIYVSEDGVKWKTTAPLPVNGSVNNITSAGGPRLIAGTTAGLIRSDDFGVSWEPVFWGLGSSSVSALRQHPTQPETLFVAQYGVVYRSENGGETWARISPARMSTNEGSLTELETIKGLVVLPGSPDRLLALTQSQGTFALSLPVRSGTAPHQSSSVTGNNGKNHTAQ